MEGHKTNLKIIIFILFFMIPISPAHSGETGHVYSTGTAMEIDRCASAWLIKRYVDKNAVFKFFPDNEMIRTGIPFDTPYSALCRTHNKSTFEVIMAKYNISGKGLNIIAKLIHDHEINYWGKTPVSEKNPVIEDLQQMINTYPDHEACFENCFSYLDRFMEKHREPKGD